MNKKQEKACLDNIQSYLDRIEWIRSLQEGDGSWKVCDLCKHFDCVDRGNGWCPAYDLPNMTVCYNQESYIEEWGEATIPRLKTRMRWLLKKYKQAGLDIEIVDK